MTPFKSFFFVCYFSADIPWKLYNDHEILSCKSDFWRFFIAEIAWKLRFWKPAGMLRRSYRGAWTRRQTLHPATHTCPLQKGPHATFSNGVRPNESSVAPPVAKAPSVNSILSKTLEVNDGRIKNRGDDWSRSTRLYLPIGEDVISSDNSISEKRLFIKSWGKQVANFLPPNFLTKSQNCCRPHYAKIKKTLNLLWFKAFLMAES